MSEPNQQNFLFSTQVGPKIQRKKERVINYTQVVTKAIISYNSNFLNKSLLTKTT